MSSNDYYGGAGQPQGGYQHYDPNQQQGYGAPPQQHGGHSPYPQQGAYPPMKSTPATEAITARITAAQRPWVACTRPATAAMDTAIMVTRSTSTSPTRRAGAGVEALAHRAAIRTRLTDLEIPQPWDGC
ncbi:hypothetical protein BKA80DRAFT_24588 [Phyllosticta citrichinensis]